MIDALLATFLVAKEDVWSGLPNMSTAGAKET